MKFKPLIIEGVGGLSIGTRRTCQMIMNHKLISPPLIKMLTYTHTYTHTHTHTHTHTRAAVWEIIAFYMNSIIIYRAINPDNTYLGLDYS